MMADIHWSVARRLRYNYRVTRSDERRNAMPMLRLHRTVAPLASSHEVKRTGATGRMNFPIC